MPRRRSSVTPIFGFFSPIFPTARLSNSMDARGEPACAEAPGLHRRITRQYRVRDPHRTGRRDGKRGPLRSSIDCCGGPAVIEPDREEQMAIDGRSADPDFGSATCPFRRARAFLVQRHSMIWQIEIDIEPGENVRSEDAVNRR